VGTYDGAFKKLYVDGILQKVWWLVDGLPTSSDGDAATGFIAASNSGVSIAGRYGQNPADVLKAFEDGAEEYNELIVVRNIPVYSHCEHHLAPFFGKATVGYMPDGKIVGLSKLTRLVECFAKRLQVQERLTIQVANALMEHLQPKAVGVVIRCRHLCMESRGIKTAGEETVTSAMLGELQPNLAMRTEFLHLAREDLGHW
jgi:GTP cyclohydrolase I